MSSKHIVNSKQAECQGTLWAGPRCRQLWLLETENYLFQKINKNSTKGEEIKQTKSETDN